MLKTAEFVSPKHPDKICDLIADSILDVYLAQDVNSRVAVEVMGGHNHITVSGEITSHGKVDIEKIVKDIVGQHFEVAVYAVRQSPQIAQGVDIGGAGDQGIMVGYATNETASLMPLEYELVRNLCQEIYQVYPYDGKVQITVDDSVFVRSSKSDSYGDEAISNRGKEIASRPLKFTLNQNGRSQRQIPVVRSVVASFQNTKTPELLKFVQSKVQAEEYLINPAGEWSIGGFDADSGLSGRKLVIDAYGPNVPVGGGSFSGKDYTKVDRSGAYMARKIAVDLLKQKQAKEVLAKLAYAIGKPQPVMATVLIDGKETAIPQVYDLTPDGIKKFLKLDQAIYAQTSNWGHFGRGFEWDK